MTEFQRQDKLSAIAELDEAYLIWKSSYLQYAPQFKAYADAQPEDIRNILWGYAEAGRLMHQRVVNLACKHMLYPNEK